MDWTQWLSVAGAIVGLAGLLGAAAVTFIARLKDELIESQKLRIEALKAEMGENDARCKESIAHLTGRVNALQTSFAIEVAKHVARALIDRDIQGGGRSGWRE